MLKVKVARKAVEDAILYHAQDQMGVEPSIETDEDLTDWVIKIYDELVGEGTIGVRFVDGGDLILEGDSAPEFVQLHVL